MTLPPRLPSRIWAIQKEIKDAYPKKVCHMPKRHDKEKREKMHTKEGMPHVHKTCQKKEEKKKNSPCPRKKYTRREIDHTKEFIHYPPKIFHTLAPLDQIV